jgi:hypothetical protein
LQYVINLAIENTKFQNLEALNHNDRYKFLQVRITAQIRHHNSIDSAQFPLDRSGHMATVDPTTHNHLNVLQESIDQHMILIKLKTI